MKRFYKSVDVARGEAGWQVTLDGRGLKTVKGSPQIVPSASLAAMLAEEWDAQGEKLDPATFVLRDLADYAIDIVDPDRAGVAEKLVAYGDTDTLLYRADPDEPLYARQQEVWEPIVREFEARESVELVRISGIIHKPQDAASLSALQKRLETHDPFALTGIEAMASLAASLVTSLSAIESADENEVAHLWRAASLEEEWQAELWGRDEEAEERRAKREAGFINAWKFARAARG